MGPFDISSIAGGSGGGSIMGGLGGIAATAIGGPLAGAGASALINKLLGGHVNLDTSTLQSLYDQLSSDKSYLDEAQRVALASTPTTDTYLSSVAAANPTLGTGAATMLAGRQADAAQRTAFGRAFEAYKTLGASRQAQQANLAQSILGTQGQQQGFNLNADASMRDQVITSIMGLLGKRYG